MYAAIVPSNRLLTSRFLFISDEFKFLIHYFVYRSVIMAGPGIRLVELRDLNTLTFHHWEWLGRKPPPVLHVPWASVPKWPHDKQVHLLALDAEGNLLKDCLMNKPL
jgi:hypothetical protein